MAKVENRDFGLLRPLNVITSQIEFTSTRSMAPQVTPGEIASSTFIYFCSNVGTDSVKESVSPSTFTNHLPVAPLRDGSEQWTGDATAKTFQMDE